MKNIRILKKRTEKRKRTEVIKSVLIFILISLLCLQAILILKSSTLTNMIFNRSSETEIILNDDDVINLYFEYTAPEYIMVNKGSARDVFFSDSEHYQRAQIILQEINRYLFMPDINPQFVEADVFNKLTESDSLYISYPYRCYPKYLAQFLNTTEEKLSSLISYYTKVVLVPDTSSGNEKITVFIQDEKTKNAVKVSTPVSSTDLVKFLSETKGKDKKNYSFAHENAALSGVEPVVLKNTKINEDILVPQKHLSMPEIMIFSPLEFSQDMGISPVAEDIMLAFGFAPSDARRYSDNNGVLVCVDEKATLKLYPNGVIEYNSVNKQSGLNLTGSSRLTVNNSYFLSFTGISKIINALIPLAGNTEKSFKVRLTDLQSESVEVSEYKFLFDYYINGIRIKNAPYHGIEATAVEGRLTSMRIDLKRFENTYAEKPVELLGYSLNNFYNEHKDASSVSVSSAYLAYPITEKSNTITADWLIQ